MAITCKNDRCRAENAIGLQVLLRALFFGTGAAITVTRSPSKGLVALCALLTCGIAFGEWRFDAPMPVVASSVFPHLESAGRRNIAVSSDTVAVVWEETRSGLPTVLLATKPITASTFSVPRVLSQGGESFEPAMVALADGRFVVVWEENRETWLAVVAGEQIVRSRLAPTARQATLATDGKRLFAAWVEQDGRFGRVVVGEIAVEAMPTVRWRQFADKASLQDEQLYPSLVAQNGVLTIAWEDRRAGHTRLYTAAAPIGQPFATPNPLNEHPSGNGPFGRGGGVTRVVLAAMPRGVAAAWMDKRDFQSGYDVYAALSADGKRFGRNELVQDEFGENHPQWHPAIAVSPQGQVVVAWDDPRDDSSDAWLSWRTTNGWSADVPLAAGPGEQSHPSLSFDAAGRLHAIWVDRHVEKTAVMYAVGVWSD